MARRAIRKKARRHGHRARPWWAAAGIAIRARPTPRPASASTLGGRAIGCEHQHREGRRRTAAAAAAAAQRLRLNSGPLRPPPPRPPPPGRRRRQPPAQREPPRLMPTLAPAARATARAAAAGRGPPRFVHAGKESFRGAPSCSATRACRPRTGPSEWSSQGRVRAATASSWTPEAHIRGAPRSRRGGGRQAPTAAARWRDPSGQRRARSSAALPEQREQCAIVAIGTSAALTACRHEHAQRTDGASMMGAARLRASRREGGVGAPS